MTRPYLQFCDRNSAEVARENAFSSGTRFVAAYLFETCAARNVVFASILITERVAMAPNPMPKAKTAHLIVREIDDETLVYDMGRHAATCLNEFDAKVWRRCDGTTSVADIVDARRGRARRLAGAASAEQIEPTRGKNRPAA
ncbi:MAG: hypothetical protein WAL59_09190 [Roseiarcus sp.]